MPTNSDLFVLSKTVARSYHLIRTNFECEIFSECRKTLSFLEGETLLETEKIFTVSWRHILIFAQQTKKNVGKHAPCNFYFRSVFTKNKVIQPVGGNILLVSSMWLFCLFTRCQISLRVFTDDVEVNSAIFQPLFRPPLRIKPVDTKEVPWCFVERCIRISRGFF